ncbi:hypothetical protein [Methylophilus sp.]|uniref:hypothetical protein n=1 Tax=Methylophilus sp. TaxID=29541 RepID=UPI0025DA2834|nr:hypothetical protein [Methylophilus sp.]
MTVPLLAGVLVAGMDALLAGIFAAGFVGGVEGAVCRGGMLLLQAASQIVSVMRHNRCK